MGLVENLRKKSRKAVIGSGMELMSLKEYNRLLSLKVKLDNKDMKSILKGLVLDGTLEYKRNGRIYVRRNRS